MDSQSKVVEPCLPSCTGEEVELPSTDEPTGTNGHDASRGIVLSPDVAEEEVVMEAPQGSTMFQITDALVATIVVLLITMGMLRQLGYSCEVSFDKKSTFDLSPAYQAPSHDDAVARSISSSWDEKIPCADKVEEISTDFSLH
jgi:hypothetical protein